MLMTALASVFLFLFIGPLNHVNSGEAGQVKLQEDVYVVVNNSLELNCSISRTIHNIHPIQLAWKHDNKWIHDFTAHVDNSNNKFIQLRKNNTGYEDAGVYECGLFNSSKFQSVRSFRVLVGEKPLVVSQLKINLKIYGRPVQDIFVEWPALQANVTNELVIGRLPAEEKYFKCKYRNTSICQQRGMYQNEKLTCHLEMDVLGTMFHPNELMNLNCSSFSQRCDMFCVKVKVTNAFGTSESNQVEMSLSHHALCPSLRNLSVSLNEDKPDRLMISWQCPRLLQKDYGFNYWVKYEGISLLTGERLFPVGTIQGDAKGGCTQQVDTIPESVMPYARYNFTATCSFLWKKMEGPAVHTEVISKEAAPSEAPHVCVVKNRTKHDAFVLWKAPSIHAWNGIPTKFVVRYDKHSVDVNTSLDELQARYNNSAATPGTMLTNLDPNKSYNVTVAMCTGGGCGIFSNPCLIPVTVTEDDSNEKVVVGPDTTGKMGVETWVAIALGLIIGLSLVVFIAYLIKRKRTRREQQPSLSSVLGRLDAPHPYENNSGDHPNFCEDDQNYDTIKECRPLLKDVDCTVANLPVTKI